jgi:hypothetical protein
MKDIEVTGTGTNAILKELCAGLGTCHGGPAYGHERLLAQVLDPTERESSKLATRPKTTTHWTRVSRHFGMFTTQASLDERGNRHEIQATDAGPNSFSNSKDHCSAKVEPREKWNWTCNCPPVLSVN